MTKNELVKHLRKHFPKMSEAKTVVDKIFEIITEALNRNEKVKISGFGTFTVKQHMPAVRRNPRTNEKVMVGPLKKVRFKPSKNLFK